MAHQEDRWKIPYPIFKQKNGKGEIIAQSETSKDWDSAKKNFFVGINAALPWGKEVEEIRDKDGGRIKWPLGFISKMLEATVDLALAAAWGVVEYVIPAVINTLTWPVRKMDEMINGKSGLETQDLKEIEKTKAEKEAAEVATKEAIEKAAKEAKDAVKAAKEKTKGDAVRDAENTTPSKPGSVVVDPSAEQVAPAKQKEISQVEKLQASRGKSAQVPGGNQH